MADNQPASQEISHSPEPEGTVDTAAPTGSPQARVTEGPTTVFAAGAVLWRVGPQRRPEVALVHRPRYDDWSLPKGKLDSGETPPHTAAREVTEETGYSCVLSRFLTHVHYSVSTREGGRTGKRVDYFSAHAGSGSFVPNEEVDELRWMSTEEARSWLSYPHDAVVLDAFDDLPPDAPTVLLVRHAKAGKRSEWSGEDERRPLSESGRRQQEALRTLLPLFGPARVYSAPMVRCEQTVAPVVEDLDLSIEREELLSQTGYAANQQAAMQRLLQIAAGSGTALVCSQGEVIPDLVSRLAVAGGLRLDEVPSRKGSVWTLTFRYVPHPGNGVGPPLQLAAAHYLPDPLPK